MDILSWSVCPGTDGAEQWTVEGFWGVLEFTHGLSFANVSSAALMCRKALNRQECRYHDNDIVFLAKTQMFEGSSLSTVRISCLLSQTSCELNVSGFWTDRWKKEDIILFRWTIHSLIYTEKSVSLCIKSRAVLHFQWCTYPEEGAREMHWITSLHSWKWTWMD